MGLAGAGAGGGRGHNVRAGMRAGGQTVSSLSVYPTHSDQLQEHGGASPRLGPCDAEVPGPVGEGKPLHSCVSVT